MTETPQFATLKVPKEPSRGLSSRGSTLTPSALRLARLAQGMPFPRDTQRKIQSFMQTQNLSEAKGPELVEGRAVVGAYYA